MESQSSKVKWKVIISTMGIFDSVSTAVVWLLVGEMSANENKDHHGET